MARVAIIAKNEKDFLAVEKSSENSYVMVFEVAHVIGSIFDSFMVTEKAIKHNENFCLLLAMVRARTVKNLN